MPPIQLLTNDFSWNIGSNTNKLQNLYTENLNVTNGFVIDGDCSFNGNLYANTFILNSSLKLNESLEVTKDVTIAGSLFVDGSMTYLNVGNSYVEDPVMTLGSGPSGEALLTNDKNARGLKLVYYDDNSSLSKEGFLGLITDPSSSHFNKFVLLESITDPSDTQLNSNSVKDGSFGTLVLKNLSASLLTASSLLLNNVNIGDKLALVDASLAALNLTDNSFVLISTFENLSGAHYTLRSEFDVLDGSAVRVEVFNDLSSAHYALRSEFDILDGSAVRVEVFDDLSSAHYALRDEFDILDGSAVRVEIFDDLSSGHYALRTEFDILDGSAVRVKIFNDLSGKHYALRNEFDVLDGSAVRVEVFDDLSTSHYALRSEFDTVETEFDDLSGKHYALISEFDTVETEFDDLSGKHYALNSSFSDLSINYYAFKSDYNNAIVLDSGSNVNIPNDLHVSKNLVVDGSFVYLNTTTTSVVDPVIDLGLDASQNPLTTHDINDRGLKLNYHDGTKSNVAFSGFITSSSESANTDYYNKFVFLDDVSYNGDKIILSDSSLAVVKALKFEGEIVSSITQITSLTVDGVTNLSTLSVSGATDLNTLTCDDASFANVDVSVNLRVDGELRIQNGNNYVGFNAHSDTSQNQIWNLPTNDGEAGQVIKTDGAGNLSWDNLVSGPAGDDRTLQFNNNGTLAGASGLTYTSNGQLLLSNSTTSGNPLLKLLQTGDGNVLEVHDQNNDNDIFFINSAGGVGINTNSSTTIDPYKLYITGDVYNSNNLIVNNYLKINNSYVDLPQKSLPTPTLIFNASLSSGIGQGSDNTVSIITNNTERFRFGSAGELLIGGTSAGTTNQVLTSNGSSPPTWSNLTELVLGQDVSFANVDISQVLNVTENINLNNSNTFINVLESDNSSNKVINTQQNIGLLTNYIGEKTFALHFMNDISSSAGIDYEVTFDNSTTINNGVNNFIVDTSYISFIDISNYGDCILEIFCNCDAYTGSSSADNYIKFDLSAIETVNNTLQTVDIDTRSVFKGLTLHMGFGTSSFKLMDTGVNNTDYTKSIDYRNKYILRVNTGIDYELSEIKLSLKVRKFNNNY